MPSDGATGTADERYRRDFGTSIACRLDPKKERGALDLGSLLTDYLIVPPVPVEFEGERIGGDATTVATPPWCEPTDLRISQEVAAALTEKLKLRTDDSSLGAAVQYVDLTKVSPTPELHGSIVFARRRLNHPLERLCEGFNALLTARLELGSEPEHFGGLGDQPLAFKLELRPNSSEDAFHEFLSKTATGSADPTLEEERKWAQMMLSIGQGGRYQCWSTVVFGPSFIANRAAEHIFKGRRNSLVVSHNGISVPVPREMQIKLPDAVAWGVLLFADRLRPELSVSRDQIRDLPWEIHSAVNLAIWRALERGNRDIDGFGLHVLADLKTHEYLTVGRLSADALLNDLAQWPAEAIFQIQNVADAVSVNELLEYVEASGEIELSRLADSVDIGNATASPVN